MKIGIYDPYLNSLGGGERYVCDIASYLQNTCDVSFFWDDPDIMKKAQDRFHLDLSRVTTVPNIWKKRNLLTSASQSRAYDVLFYVSDGSIPTSFARKTVLIFQFPVNWVGGKSLVTRLKLARVSQSICYSRFVKTFIDRTFGMDALVVTPAVDAALFEPGRKTKTILSVGRFTKGKNAKKQHVLIDAFKTFSQKNPGWSLVLAGGALPEDRDFVSGLEAASTGFPIVIMPNIPFADLVKLYACSALYWHAAGYGEDLEKHPDRAEHFGLTTVEAMCAGSVPVVFNGGGQAEIVRDGQDGYVWNTKEELLKKTELLARSSVMLAEASNRAIKRAHQYDEERFHRSIDEIIAA